MSDFYTLYLFAKRATLLAIRSNDPGWAVAGAQSFAFIDQTRMDWRDFTWAVALIAFALHSTGNDVPATLGEVAVFASTEAQETILRFAADPPTSLHQWGYEIIETRDGTVFADTNSERYEPTSDLVPIALSVADALNADRYHVDSITVRSGLPEVWLRGPHHTEAVAAVGRMLACTSVHACPLPVMEIGMPDHMFLVFIAEMKSSEDADTVALAARTNDREGASLGLSSGSICCIAIARSVVLGVDSIESNESIQRFSHVFHDAVVRGTTGS